MSAVTTELVLAEVNAHHSSSWRLERALHGGRQSGALLVVDATGRRAVLKWSEETAWAPVVVAAAPIVRTARAGGWPTPEWLVAGTTSDGFGYEVQDFASGSVRTRIGHDWLDLVLPVLAGQEGLATEEMRDWSARDRAVVFHDRERHQSVLLGHGGAAAAVVDAVRLACAHDRRARIPSTDLVHGDLDPGNVLIDGAQVALVDVEAVGRGTRLHDLSTLLLHDSLNGVAAVEDRIVAECQSVAGPAVFRVVLGAVALDLMSFGLRRWPTQQFERSCRVVASLIERLSTP